jgi:hypothetical protein
MINSTKIFTFNGIASTSFTPSILNVTLDNDFYNFAPLGARTIREEKISGRDLPYFYDTDIDVISFPMTIAFDGYATQAQVNEVIKWLYLPKTPKLLQFTEYGLNYFGMFIDEPRFYYVGNNLDGFKFIGYIEVNFRANAPYGWTNLIVNPVFDYVLGPDDQDQYSDGDIIFFTDSIVGLKDINNNNVVQGIYTFLNGVTGGLYPGIRAAHTIINTGDMVILPSFTLTNTLNDITVDVSLTCNGRTFSYRLAGGEVLTFNGYTKIFSSSVTQNPYSAWNIGIPKDYLYFEPGSNTVTMNNPNASIAYSFRAPKIL